MIQKVILGIILLLVALVGYETYSEFMMNHTYYYDMFKNVDSWKLIVWALITAFIPTAYIIRSSKNISLKTFCITIFASLFIFSIAHISVKSGGLPGIMGPTAFIKLFINTALIFGVSVYFLLGVQALGNFISHRLLHFSQHRIQEMFLALGLGLVSYILVVSVLLHLGILHPILMWIVFLSLGFFIYIQKLELQKYEKLITDILKHLQLKNLQQNPIHIIAIVLIVLSLIYYFFGFNLAYIPYPTAWDANHAYMFYPKVWASNWGIFSDGSVMTTPYIRNVYIASWFSLFQNVDLGIAADTRAVSMNFLSGILVLIFGVAMIYQAVNFFSEYLPKRELTSDAEMLITYSGWFMMLLWLTSGMGAFLVFIDNKTDLGVMALTTLAIMSGFIFLWMIEHRSKEVDQKQLYSYIIVSGLFFAAAALAKPTAMQDIILFVLLVVGLWFGAVFLMGGFLFVIGLLAFLNEQGFQHFDLGPTGPLMMLLGVLLMGANVFYSLTGKTDYFLGMRTKIMKNLQYLKYLVVWGVAVLVAIVVVKGPYMIASGIIGDQSLGTIVKNILMASTETGEAEDKVLLAQLDQAALASLTDQSVTDQSIIAQNNNAITPAQCEADYADQTLEDLTKDLKAIEGGGVVEDLGRYIWKNGVRRKEFKHPSQRTDEEKAAYGPVRLGYRVLSMFVRGEGCHSWDKNAKLLCENNHIFAQTLNRKSLTDLAGQMNPSGSVYDAVQSVLNTELVKNAASDIIDENSSFIQRKKLIDTFQHRVVYKDVNGTIYIPYKNLIPLNVIFNWSLQNASSYYTDIGFFWMIPLLLLIIGFVYALVRRHYQLIVLHLIGIAGWILWWLIAHAIIWYAVGLILWTILANLLFLRYIYHWLKDENDKILFYALLILIGIFGATQILFNYVRIGSQGISGHFVWYKTNVGYEFPYGVEYSPTAGLQVKSNKIDYNFTAKELFNTQFSHYNEFLERTEGRSGDEGLLVAGTYMRYFIKNQKNLLDDGLLGTIGQYVGDEDPCKFYMRMKKKNLKYLAIDPNISSVASSTKDTLFTRFLADIDPVQNKIIHHGVFTLLAELVEQGYAKLMYSNNLAIQYGYGLTNEQLLSYIDTYPDPAGKEFLQGIARKDMTLLRSQMMAARFFGQQAQMVYSSFVGYVFQVRLQSGEGLQDMAYVYGKIVNPAKLLPLVSPLLAGQKTAELDTAFNEDLTKDEKFILTEYLQYMTLMQRGDRANLDQLLRNILTQSLSSPSQLAAFELK